MKNMKMGLGRALITIGFGLLIVLFAWEVFGANDEMRVIEVRRNIPLADQDPVYRDFYINAGLEAGLKPNQVVIATRKINAKDAAGTQSFGELMVPVGQLKIIFAQSHIAVAREYKLLSREDLPMLEQMGVMIGDLIDLKGSFIDNRKSSAKTHSQKEKAPSPEVAKTPDAPVTPTNTAEVEAKKPTPAAPAPAPASDAATEAKTEAPKPQEAQASEPPERVADKTE